MQRQLAAAGNLRAELERRATAAAAAREKLDATRLRLQLEGDQLGSLKHKVGLGAKRWWAEGGRFVCCPQQETLPVEEGSLSSCTRCLACMGAQLTARLDHSPEIPPQMTPAPQIQELEAVREEERKKAEGLERELAALAKQQYRAGQALHAAQEAARRLGSDISGARAQGRNLRHRMAQLEEQLEHQQVCEGSNAWGLQSGTRQQCGRHSAAMLRGATHAFWSATL